jgi:hypothetical protein
VYPYLLNYSVRRRPSDFFVVVGAHRLNLRGSEESWLFAREIHVHPNYRSPLVRKWSHDLAIVELRNEHPYEKTGRPACLPTNEALIPNENCVVLGWGQTDSECVPVLAPSPLSSAPKCATPTTTGTATSTTRCYAPALSAAWNTKALAHAKYYKKNSASTPGRGRGGHLGVQGIQNIPRSAWVKTDAVSRRFSTVVAFAVLLTALVFTLALRGTFCTPCTRPPPGTDRGGVVY